MCPSFFELGILLSLSVLKIEMGQNKFTSKTKLVLLRIWGGVYVISYSTYNFQMSINLHLFS